jgi:hypothetical protein
MELSVLPKHRVYTVLLVDIHKLQCLSQTMTLRYDWGKLGPGDYLEEGCVIPTSHRSLNIPELSLYSPRAGPDVHFFMTPVARVITHSLACTNRVNIVVTVTTHL